MPLAKPKLHGPLRPLAAHLRPVSICRPAFHSTYSGKLVLIPGRRSLRIQRTFRKSQRFAHRTGGISVQALWGSGNTDNGSSKNAQSARRQAMLDFVNSLNPGSDSSGFDVPAPVVIAMRQTVTNLLGTLPPQFFRVTISTRSDNLAQLMFSVLMTGYMFCNGYYRMQLQQSLGTLQVPSGRNTDNAALIGTSSGGSLDEEMMGGSTSNGLMAAGTQKLRVEGEVLKWHHEDGVQQVPALEYIEQLEAELQLLQRQLADSRAAAAAAAASAPTQSRSAIHDTHNNELLEYLKGLTGEQVAELTDCATPDVLEAMNALVRRLIGEDGQEGEWGKGKSECSATELAQLLCWLMSVGHQLRTMEVRLSLLASMENGAAMGANDGDDGPAASNWVPRLPPGR